MTNYDAVQWIKKAAKFSNPRGVTPGRALRTSNTMAIPTVRGGRSSTKQIGMTGQLAAGAGPSTAMSTGANQTIKSADLLTGALLGGGVGGGFAAYRWWEEKQKKKKEDEEKAKKQETVNDMETSTMAKSAAAEWATELAKPATLSQTADALRTEEEQKPEEPQFNMGHALLGGGLGISAYALYKLLAKQAPSRGPWTPDGRYDAVRAVREKDAGVWSEFGGAIANPINSVWGGNLAGAIVPMITKTRNRREQTVRDGDLLKNLLIPGWAANNIWKRIGHSIRGPEAKKDQAAYKTEVQAKKDAKKKEKAEAKVNKPIEKAAGGKSDGGKYDFVKKLLSKVFGPSPQQAMLKSRHTMRTGGRGIVGYTPPPYRAWEGQGLSGPGVATTPGTPRPNYLGPTGIRQSYPTNRGVGNPRFEKAMDTALTARHNQLMRQGRQVPERNYEGVKSDVLRGRGHSPSSTPITEMTSRRSALGQIGRGAAKSQATRGAVLGGGATGAGGAALGSILSGREKANSAKEFGTQMAKEACRTSKRSTKTYKVNRNRVKNAAGALSAGQVMEAAPSPKTMGIGKSTGAGAGLSPSQYSGLRDNAFSGAGRGPISAQSVLSAPSMKTGPTINQFGQHSPPRQPPMSRQPNPNDILGPQTMRPTPPVNPRSDAEVGMLPGAFSNFQDFTPDSSPLPMPSKAPGGPLGNIAGAIGAGAGAAGGFVPPRPPAIDPNQDYGGAGSSRPSAPTTGAPAMSQDDSSLMEPEDPSQWGSAAGMAGQQAGQSAAETLAPVSPDSISAPEYTEPAADTLAGIEPYANPDEATAKAWANQQSRKAREAEMAQRRSRTYSNAKQDWRGRNSRLGG